uniref:Uncharacterized protein n=1 Tax=Timema cristinae TaxID=61476 RepID=A0A7R9DDM6_TIMCR|nr:unnamed protein product [Timema cristinae]
MSEPWSFIVAERDEPWEGKKGGDIPLCWKSHVGNGRPPQNPVSGFDRSNESSAVLAELREWSPLLLAPILLNNVSESATNHDDTSSQLENSTTDEGPQDAMTSTALKPLQIQSTLKKMRMHLCNKQ